MTLQDRPEMVTSDKLEKTIAQEEIARQVAEFLSAGNKIDHVQQGETGHKPNQMPIKNANRAQRKQIKQEKSGKAKPESTQQKVLRVILSGSGVTVFDVAESLGISRRRAQTAVRYLYEYSKIDRKRITGGNSNNRPFYYYPLGGCNED